MSAYSILYLKDTSELQEMLFQAVAKYKYELDYEHFVSNYMRCMYRTLLDKGSARVANMVLDEYMAYLEKYCTELFKPGVTDVDSLMSGWIGRMYNILQFHTNLSSTEIYDKLPIQDMKLVFRPLHTVSEDIAVKKLMQRLNS